MRGKNRQLPSLESLTGKEVCLFSVNLANDIPTIAGHLKAFFQKNRDPRLFANKQPIAFIISENQLTPLVHFLYSLQEGENRIIPLGFDIRNICYILADDSMTERVYEDLIDQRCQETIEFIQNGYKELYQKDSQAPEIRNDRRRSLSNARLEAWLNQQKEGSVWVDVTDTALCLVDFAKGQNRIALLERKVCSALVRVDFFQVFYERALSEEFKKEKAELLGEYLAEYKKLQADLASTDIMKLIQTYGTKGTLGTIKNKQLAVEKKIENLAEQELSQLNALHHIFKLLNAMSSRSPLKVIDDVSFSQRHELPEGITSAACPYYARRISPESGPLSLSVKFIARAVPIVREKEAILSVIRKEILDLKIPDTEPEIGKSRVAIIVSFANYLVQRDTAAKGKDVDEKEDGRTKRIPMVDKLAQKISGSLSVIVSHFRQNSSTDDHSSLFDAYDNFVFVFPGLKLSGTHKKPTIPLAAWVRHALNDKIAVTNSTKPGALTLNGEGKLTLIPSDDEGEDIYTRALDKVTRNYFPDLRITQGCFYDVLEAQCDNNQESQRIFMAQIDYWLCGILNDGKLSGAKAKLGIITEPLNELFSKAVKNKETKTAEQCQEFFLTHVIKIAKDFYLTPQELLAYLQFAQTLPLVHRQTHSNLLSPRSLKRTDVFNFLQNAIEAIRQGDRPDSVRYKEKTWAQLAISTSVNKADEPASAALKHEC